MVSSINNGGSDNMQLLMAQMFQKMNAADTDGVSGLSKSELSSIDTGSDKGGTGFLKSLSDQFDSLDADGNGQLSSDEIASAKPQGPPPMGPPPGMTIDSSDSDSDSLTGSVSSTDSTDSTGSTDSTSSTSSSNSMESLIENLLEKLLASLSQSYGQGGDSTASNSDKVSSLVSSSDTDKNGSLSVDELKSVDTSGNTGKAGFVNDLVKNFSQYDTDGDGSLSQTEMLAAMPKDASQQATTAMSGGSNSLSGLENNLKAFMDKLVSAYKDSGGLTTAASALSIAG